VATNRRRLFFLKALDSSGWKFDPLFEDRLRKEISKTELLRVNILIGAILIAFTAGMLNFFFLGNAEDKSIIGTHLWLLIILITSILGYEIFNAYILWRHVRNRRAISRGIQFSNIVIETSFPSIFALILFQQVHDYAVLFTPVLLLYFLSLCFLHCT